MEMAARVARLGLIGGECTGKSTLAASLASALDACLVPEYLREFVDTHGRGPRRDEQGSILRVQQDREDAAARSCASGVLVADPAALMTAVYSIAYFDDDTLVEKAVDLAGGYDLLVWCDVDLPWVADGVQRDGPEARKREHEILANLVVDRLRPAGLDVLEASGPVEGRLTAVLRAWQPRGPERST